MAIKRVRGSAGAEVEFEVPGPGVSQETFDRLISSGEWTDISKAEKSDEKSDEKPSETFAARPVYSTSTPDKPAASQPVKRGRPKKGAKNGS